MRPVNTFVSCLLLQCRIVKILSGLSVLTRCIADKQETKAGYSINKSQLLQIYTLVSWWTADCQFVGRWDVTFTGYFYIYFERVVFIFTIIQFCRSCLYYIIASLKTSRDVFFCVIFKRPTPTDRAPSSLYPFMSSHARTHTQSPQIQDFSGLQYLRSKFPSSRRVQHLLSACWGLGGEDKTGENSARDKNPDQSSHLSLLSAHFILRATYTAHSNGNHAVLQECVITVSTESN